MTTVTFSEEVELGRIHFDSIEDFQNHLLMIKEKQELSDEHKSILDERLKDSEFNPDSHLSIEDLKKEIKRR